ncbi:MAG: ABC transporter ATP-binding protein [Planctomycetota bacterium]|jgi:ABC-2 type transport system ATP-binding protein|nr:ABC transporter ATP-binding protein [Planctomycetota bacterium]
MIEIRELSKHFGAIKAVDNISFQVERGEVLGFLGPNGAGKSTTMKMVTGFLAPSSGGVSVCGFDVATDSIAAKACIGYLPEGAPLYGDMTPRALLHFVSEVRGLDAARRAERVAEVTRLVQLEGVLDQRIETLSKGFKRRVGIAQAIVHDPEVLVLDEPTDGLDPNQKHEVRKLIRDMAQDKVIVLSTHILEEVEAVCSRAIIISQGRLCFDGTPAELEARSHRHNAISLALHIAGDNEVQAALSAVDGVEHVEATGNDTEGMSSWWIHPAEGSAVLSNLSSLFHERNWEVDHLSVERGRLDEVFRDITTGSAR